MGAPLVTLTEIKTYLGKTGTDDDLLIASIASNATAMAEQDTARLFSVTSNVSTTYSTDGQTSLVIHDRPYNDATRVVKLLGVTLVEGTNVWFLPDRADPDSTHTVQLRFYQKGDWYVRDFYWFDGNHDNPRWAAAMGSPNDLVITGTVGHPNPPPEVKMAITELACWLYWRAKGGASSYVSSLTGSVIQLDDYPPIYKQFLDRWTIHTAVAVIG